MINRDIEDSTISFSSILRMCGYAHQITSNLALILLFAALILIVFFIAMILDLKMNKGKKKRNSKSKCVACVTNFNLRFIYEFFLELCICVAI